MIDYIVYSEFDINEGNVVKIEYPKKQEFQKQYYHHI